jgi:vacuolar-type H+-ATPase subunit I/STV1
MSQSYQDQSKSFPDAAQVDTLSSSSSEVSEGYVIIQEFIADTKSALDDLVRGIAQESSSRAGSASERLAEAKRRHAILLKVQETRDHIAYIRGWHDETVKTDGPDPVSSAMLLDVEEQLEGVVSQSRAWSEQEKNLADLAELSTVYEGLMSRLESVVRELSSLEQRVAAASPRLELTQEKIDISRKFQHLAQLFDKLLSEITNFVLGLRDRGVFLGSFSELETQQAWRAFSDLKEVIEPWSQSSKKIEKLQRGDQSLDGVIGGVRRQLGNAVANELDRKYIGAREFRKLIAKLKGLVSAYFSQKPSAPVKTPSTKRPPSGRQRKSGRLQSQATELTFAEKLDHLDGSEEGPRLGALYRTLENLRSRFNPKHKAKHKARHKGPAKKSSPVLAAAPAKNRKKR